MYFYAGVLDKVGVVLGLRGGYGLFYKSEERRAFVVVAWVAIVIDHYAFFLVYDGLHWPFWLFWLLLLDWLLQRRIIHIEIRWLLWLRDFFHASLLTVLTPVGSAWFLCTIVDLFHLQLRLFLTHCVCQSLVPLAAVSHYNITIIQSIIKLVCIIIFKLKHMIPSPTSSLSSFRDYYRHTSEASEEMPTSDQFIDQGIRNFKITKVFTKLNWKIEQERYWVLFFCFKKMVGKIEVKRNAMAALLKILKRKDKSEAKVAVQCQYLGELMKNVKDQRDREIAQAIKFTLVFLKRNFINAAFSYKNVLTHLRGKKQPSKKEVPADKKKYILKLSKAVLCIVVRNIIDKTVFRYLREVKYQCPKEKMNPSHITFFKPKKEKVYEHRRQVKTEKMIKIMAIANILQRKRYHIFRSFFVRICKQEIKIQSQSDAHIYTDAVRHMIYLTGQSKSIREKPQKMRLEEVKALKLQHLLRRASRRGSKIRREYLLQWRRVANEQHGLLRREILKLEMIKKYYMDQI